MSTFAETNASWLPNGLAEFDENYLSRMDGFAKKLQKLPSEYVREHVYFSFIQDSLVPAMLDLLPLDNLMWGSDFPHSVGSFPHSCSWLNETFATVPPEVTRKILVETPSRFFNLDLETELTQTTDVLERTSET